jgi:hypothetical protein
MTAMRLRVQAIALLLATFSLTLGILLWRQRGTPQQELLSADPQAPPVADARTAIPAPPPTARAQGVASAASSTPQTRVAVAPEEVAKAPPLPDIEVPVSVVLTGQAATLRNGSARALDLTVTASNQETGHHASTQVTLAPFQRLNIDGDEFVVEHGDVLTLHSPPFHDRAIETDTN